MLATLEVTDPRDVQALLSALRGVHRLARGERWSVAGPSVGGLVLFPLALVLACEHPTNVALVGLAGLLLGSGVFVVFNAFRFLTMTYQFDGKAVRFLYPGDRLRWQLDYSAISAVRIAPAYMGWQLWLHDASGTQRWVWCTDSIRAVVHQLVR